MLESPSPNNGLRLIFAGTPVFAAHHLQALIDSPHSIVAVYSQPDRPAGRGKRLTQSPVKVLALEHHLTVQQPVSLKGKDVQAVLEQYKADVMVVVAYGLLLPKAVLGIPHYGCINVHGSLLPRWRGAAPIQRAIGAGDSHSGITIMQMDVGLDTGDMLYKSECELAADETSASLHNKLMVLGAEALLETLQQVQLSTVRPIKQHENLATYAGKITKEEAQINWQQPASIIERNIRAYNPFPIAYTFLEGKRIKLYYAQDLSNPDDKALLRESIVPGKILSFSPSGLEIACGEGVLRVDQLQLPGKKPMDVADLTNGYSDFFSVGKCFGQ